ncbi:MAG: hypothetical protein ACXV3A_02200 [Kineosporiaceae bacterium]
MVSSACPRSAARVALAVLAVAGLAGTSACQRSATSTAAAVSSSSSSAASPSSSAGPSPSGSSGMAMPAPGQDQGAAAGVRLEALVAQHSVLVADMMRARMRQAPDLAQAADAALGQNTQALGSLVDNLFGIQAGAQFAQVWSGHIRYFYAYADALANNDDPALQRAKTGLESSEKALGRFFSAASGGRLPEPAAQSAVTTHIDHLLAQADAFHKGDYATAAADYQMAYEHGFDMGGALASTLLPQALADQLQQPQWKLRSNLTKLLGEHVALVVAAMRDAMGQAADFKALAVDLNKNTTALGMAVYSLYGDKASGQFQNLWADHVDALMTYTSATIKGDSTAANHAETKLRSFEPALARFLAMATQSQLGAQALANAYNQHDRMLVGELKAYQAKNYTQAHQLSYQAYDQMFDLSAQLSHAIGVTLGKNLPKGGSQTGGGGMASVVGRR